MPRRRRTLIIQNANRGGGSEPRELLFFSRRYHDQHSFTASAPSSIDSFGQRATNPHRIVEEDESAHLYGNPTIPPPSHTSGSGSGSKEERADSMEQAAERISNVTLDTSPFGEKVRPGKTKTIGPSLLSQQAPGDAGPSSAISPSPSKPPPYTKDLNSGRSNDVGPNGEEPTVSTSAMSVDAHMPFLEGTEKITVKIADLGNGE